jgi:acetyl/propionyl-CoA carboxylase alpha subunit
MKVIARVGERTLSLEVAPADGGLEVRIDGREESALVLGSGPFRTITLDGRAAETCAWRRGGPAGAAAAGAAGLTDAWDVALDGRLYEVRLADPLRASDAPPAAATGPLEVRAVMPGKVVAILAVEGTAVAAGQGLLVVEAMKMENEIAAPRAGRVAAVCVRPGEAVDAGAPLVVLDPPESAS